MKNKKQIIHKSSQLFFAWYNNVVLQQILHLCYDTRLYYFWMNFKVNDCHLIPFVSFLFVYSIKINHILIKKIIMWILLYCGDRSIFFWVFPTKMSISIVLRYHMRPYQCTNTNITWNSAYSESKCQNVCSDEKKNLLKNTQKSI